MSNSWWHSKKKMMGPVGFIPGHGQSPGSLQYWTTQEESENKNSKGEKESYLTPVWCSLFGRQKCKCEHGDQKHKNPKDKLQWGSRLLTKILKLTDNSKSPALRPSQLKCQASIHLSYAGTRRGLEPVLADIGGSNLLLYCKARRKLFLGKLARCCYGFICTILLHLHHLWVDRRMPSNVCALYL